MRNGFTFNDRHSSEFDATVKTKSRPLRPQSKHYSVDLPCRDGEYDFSFSGPDGCEHFYERTFVVTLSIYADNLAKMQNKLANISRWLIGRGKLIFDDMPLMVWNGKVTDEIVYMPEHNGRKAVVEASFRVHPFAECTFDTEGPMLDTEGLYLDDLIPIDFDVMYCFSKSNGQEQHIMNFGDRPISPVISITGPNSDTSLSINGDKLDFYVRGDTVVDCEKQNVINVNGTCRISGTFPFLLPGDNILHIENSNLSVLNFKISFTPQFIYNMNINETDWGC